MDTFCFPCLIGRIVRNGFATGYHLRPTSYVSSAVGCACLKYVEFLYVRMSENAYHCTYQ